MARRASQSVRHAPPSLWARPQERTMRRIAQVPIRVPAAPTAHPLRPLLLHWLSLGLLAVLLLPAARGQHLLLGWLPYWLVVAPALSLLVLDRHRWTAALAGYLVGRRRRASRVPPRQARRHPARAARRSACAGTRAGARRTGGVHRAGRAARVESRRFAAFYRRCA
jgi:hypothetical protein